MIKHRFLSRSALVQWQRCPRLGYLTNVYGGRGRSPLKKSSPLALGTANHAGVETLMKGLRDGRISVDSAIDRALSVYTEETPTGLVGIPDRFMATVRREHHAIVEASIRLYAAHRLPIIAEKYEIVEVEAEHTIKLTPKLTLISRPDAVFADRFSGTLDVFSLKNPGKYDYRKTKDANADMQGLSEMYATQHDYPDRIVKSVMMEHIIVGKEEEVEVEDGTDNSSYPIRRSPLVRGWMRPAPSGMGFEVAWRYEYENPDYDPAKPRKAGNFKSTRLSPKKGWGPVASFEYEGGVKAWVEALASNSMIPRHRAPAEEIFQYPPVYDRRQEDIDGWLESTVYEQSAISRRIELYEEGELTFNQAFPKYTHSCTYPAKCPFFDVCHKGHSPDDPKFFIERVPHHEQERLAPLED